MPPSGPWVVACCARTSPPRISGSAGTSRSDALAPFVDYYWIPRWDLRGKPPYEQTILPHPNVHLVFEASGAGIFGVDRRLFTRSLSGLGLAFGVRFTAGRLPAVLAGADLPADRPGGAGRAAVRAAGGEDPAGDHGCRRFDSGAFRCWTTAR